jgi:hypothetical protein
LAACIIAPAVFVCAPAVAGQAADDDMTARQHATMSLDDFTADLLFQRQRRVVTTGANF